MKKSMKMGIIAGIAMLIFYFGILTIAESFSHAISQFMTMWYLILALVIGFGIQVGLYFHVRASIQVKAATAEVATAGGVSTGSMIVCCLHHVTDVIPILGLSAAAIFLTQYQSAFIVLAIFSNLVGITMMLNIIQRHELHGKQGFMNKIFGYNMKTVRNATVLLSVIIIAAVFAVSGNLVVSGSNSIVDNTNEFTLPTKVNEANGLSIDATPIDFSFDNPVRFDIGLNTHQGSLDYDMAKVSVLEDGVGNSYEAINWDGPPPGGHHISGILTFPKLKEETNQIKLIIKEVYGIPERVFVWDL